MGAWKEREVGRTRGDLLVAQDVLLEKLEVGVHLVAVQIAHIASVCGGRHDLSSAYSPSTSEEEEGRRGRRAPTHLHRLERSPGGSSAASFSAASSQASREGRTSSCRVGRELQCRAQRQVLRASARERKRERESSARDAPRAALLLAPLPLLVQAPHEPRDAHDQARDLDLGERAAPVHGPPEALAHAGPLALAPPGAVAAVAARAPEGRRGRVRGRREVERGRTGEVREEVRREEGDERCGRRRPGVSAGSCAACATTGRERGTKGTTRVRGGRCREGLRRKSDARGSASMSTTRPTSSGTLASGKWTPQSSRKRTTRR